MKQLILNKKTATLVILVALLVGYEFSNIYTPEDFERPIYFRLKVMAMKFAGNLVNEIKII